MHRLLTALIALMAAAWLAPAVPASTKTLGIAFYNLENFFDTVANNPSGLDAEWTPSGEREWTSERYRRKTDSIAAVISRMTTPETPGAPALIGLAEVENASVLDNLTAALARLGLNYRYVHYDSPDPRGIDVALLYDPMMFRVLKSNTRTLAIDTLPGFATRDQLAVTGLLGNGSTGTVPVGVIVNHWPSRRGGELQSAGLRKEAAALTASIAAGMAREMPGIGIVAMGDFNDDPHSPSLASALGAVRSKEAARGNAFFNPFWEMFDRGKGTIHAGRQWNLFDQILVNGWLSTGMAGARLAGARVWDVPGTVITEAPGKGTPLRTYTKGAYTGGCSDHLPAGIFLEMIPDASVGRPPVYVPKTVPTN